MSEDDMAKYIVYGLDGDPDIPCLASAHWSADMGMLVLSIVGAGNPYFSFDTLPIEILTADELGADFSTAPLASSDYQTNRDIIAAMWSDPPPTGPDNDGINVVWKVA
jgi:hypothetical protein